jgi:Na+/glutamate symporter
MSSGGFHVHGPHDHAIEHATHGHGDGHGSDHASHGDEGHGSGNSSTNKIAMFTAIVATVGAIFAYMGGATQANAGLMKNDAAIKKTEASNQWNYFQSKSTKQSLAELARDLTPGEQEKAKYQAKIDRYETEKNEIKKVAEGLEADAHAFDQKSEAQMHQHHRWAQATTALQVAIALAAIALLTRKKWLEWGMYGVAAVGLGVGTMALLHI